MEQNHNIRKQEINKEHITINYAHESCKWAFSIVKQAKPSTKTKAKFLFNLKVYVLLSIIIQHVQWSLNVVFNKQGGLNPN